MHDRTRAHEFADFVARDRRLLLGAACLMFGGRSRAEDVVSASLAQLYGEWPGPAAARRTALLRVLDAVPDRLSLPWRRAERFELVDSSLQQPPTPGGVLADLAGLDEQARRAVILHAYAGLPTAELAAMTGTGAERAEELLARARRDLSTLVDVRKTGPDRRVGTLDQQLRAAAAAELDGGSVPAAATDLAHGRLLLRRRRVRVASVVVVVVLAVTQVVPAVRLAIASPAPAVSASTAATPPPPRMAATCNPRDQDCQVELVRNWRNEMSRIAVSYLDPRETYFSGYTFSYDDAAYDSPSFWRGDGGVLGFDLFRLQAGATEVYLQIASSPRFATPCGRRTRHRCRPIQFMDGNVYTLTDTTTVAEGMEAQYSPNGEDVVTVVARNTTEGRSLDITRGELMSLVSDPRLRLPSI